MSLGDFIGRDNRTKYTLFIFLLLTFWWVIIFVGGTKDSMVNHVFGFIYGGFSLWGGIWGLIVAKQWGGMKSVMGRGILALAFGLLLQAFGQYSFWYFNYVLKIPVPYPGIPDIGYLGTIPFYIYAAVCLAKASGVKVSLRSFKNKLQALIIPLVMVAIGYGLFLKDYSFADATTLQVLFDFGYPLGQAVYISIAILTYSLSRGILGGVMKNRILLLIFAFSAQFLADYIFIYFHDLYFPASFIDFFYLFAYAIMTLGILQLRSVLTKLSA